MLQKTFDVYERLRKRERVVDGTWPGCWLSGSKESTGIAFGVWANTVSVEGYTGDRTCWLLHFQSSDQEEVDPGLGTRDLG